MRWTCWKQETNSIPATSSPRKTSLGQLLYSQVERSSERSLQHLGRMRSIFLSLWFSHLPRPPAPVGMQSYDHKVMGWMDLSSWFSSDYHEYYCHYCCLGLSHAKITLSYHQRSQAATCQFHTAVMLTADFLLERRTSAMVSASVLGILLLTLWFGLLIPSMSFLSCSRPCLGKHCDGPNTSRFRTAATSNLCSCHAASKAFCAGLCGSKGTLRIGSPNQAFREKRVSPGHARESSPAQSVYLPTQIERQEAARPFSKKPTIWFAAATPAWEGPVGKQRGQLSMSLHRGEGPNTATVSRLEYIGMHCRGRLSAFLSGFFAFLIFAELRCHWPLRSELPSSSWWRSSACRTCRRQQPLNRCGMALFNEYFQQYTQAAWSYACSLVRLDVFGSYVAQVAEIRSCLQDLDHVSLAEEGHTLQQKGCRVCRGCTGFRAEIPS